MAGNHFHISNLRYETRNNPCIYLKILYFCGIKMKPVSKYAKRYLVLSRSLTILGLLLKKNISTKWENFQFEEFSIWCWEVDFWWKYNFNKYMDSSFELQQTIVVCEENPLFKSDFRECRIFLRFWKCLLWEGNFTFLKTYCKAVADKMFSHWFY